MAANEDKSIVIGVDMNISQAERELAKKKSKAEKQYWKKPLKTRMRNWKSSTQIQKDLLGKGWSSPRVRLKKSVPSKIESKRLNAI